MSRPPLLELRGIQKSFPGVKALSDMTFTVMPSSVHVICGENGAGKSTLCKIINGIYQPDAGTILVNGQETTIPTPIKAREYKVSMIAQELNYIPEMTIEEFLFLGDEPLNAFRGVNWKAIRRQSVKLLQSEKLPFEPDTKLKNLTVSNIQMLEIVKATSMHESNIVVMDEPTSAITDKEVDVLFRKIAELKAKGVGIIYISHKLAELFRIADQITVIRDGAYVESRPASELNIERVIQLMVGRLLTNVFPPKPEIKLGDKKVEVIGLTDGDKFRDITLNVRAGEVVGLSGLMGAGRTEVARAMFGLDLFSGGMILVDGKPAKIRHIQDAMKLGMAMLTEDRKRYGIIPMRSIRENVGLATLKKIIFGGRRHKDTENKLVGDACGRMRVKAPSVETTIESLSGGNQQKVVFAKWMLRDPEILILDEPTRGIDVGAKYEIYKIMLELAAAGKAILMISSELPELIGVCDRIYVMSHGHITGELQTHEFDQERIMKFATQAAQAA